MDPSRKRRIRLIVSLTAAVVLALALVYTSFSAAQPVVTPTQLLHEAVAGRTYQLSGTVVPDSIVHSGSGVSFRVADRAGSTDSVAVTYDGEVPDPFAAGREIIINVERDGATFSGQGNSLVTKCPSKYTPAPSGSTSA
jgi:cytochrome c-type biogenesis protein CcmE